MILKEKSTAVLGKNFSQEIGLSGLRSAKKSATIQSAAKEEKCYSAEKKMILRAFNMTFSGYV